jgi:hypothetical protein
MIFRASINKILVRNTIPSHFIVGCMPFNAENPTCLRERNSLSHARNPNSPAAIIGLLLFGCPAAIFWLVSFVYVFSLYCETLGPSTHIASEISEVIPSLTNSYSPASVIGEAFIPRVVASLPHAAPNRISGTPIRVIFHMVPNASTGHSVAACESANCGDFLFSAFTQANDFIFNLRNSYDSEFLELLTDSLLAKHSHVSTLVKETPTNQV